MTPSPRNLPSNATPASGHTPGDGNARPVTATRHGLWTTAAAALFMLRVLPWAGADLWYDEILTLRLFVWGKTSPGEIFRDYRIANNHFLNSALSWLWNRLPFVAPGDELMQRLPAIIAGAAAVAVAAWCWRRWLGSRLALAVAVLIALSPVQAAFACQLRGYALAMLLSTIAVTLAARHLEAPACGSAIGLLASCALLPLAMPSAAMAGGALAAWMAFARNWKPKWRQLRTALPALAGTALGTAYYFTLWRQFCHARIDAGGWQSGIAAMAHIMLAFALHLGFLLTGFCTTRSREDAGGTDNAGGRLPATRRSALVLAGGTLLVIAALLALPSPNHRVPFPRVFLVMLPLLTFAAALLCRNTRLASMRTMTLLLLAAAPAVAATAICDAITARRLDHCANPPQNLLLQYYRGQDDASQLLSYLQKLEVQEAIPAHFRMLAAPVDHPAVEFYWQLAGRQLIHRGRPAVVPTNALPPYFPAGEKIYAFLRPPDAAGMPTHLRLTPVAHFKHHILYLVSH